MAIKLSLNKTLYPYDNMLEAYTTEETVISVELYTTEDLTDAVLLYSQEEVQGSTPIENNVAEIPGRELNSGPLNVSVMYNSTLSNSVSIRVTKVSSGSDTLIDDDPYFTLGRDKRIIAVPSSQGILAVNRDNNSEVVRFKFPRYVDGVDLSRKEIYVNYEMKDLYQNKALCDLLSVDESYIEFAWVISEYATQFEGTLEFSVEFSSEGYRWQTQVASAEIARSIVYSGAIQDIQPELLESYLREFRSISENVKQLSEKTEEAAKAFTIDQTLTQPGQAADSKVVGDSISELKANIADNTKSDAVTKRSLDALWKLNQGISYQFETDESEAYSKTVPSGAKLASVDSIGGKSVVWNQLNSNDTYSGSITKNGVTYTLTDKTVTIDGTASSNSNLPVCNFAGKYVTGHKILVLPDKDSDGTWGFSINGPSTPIYIKRFVDFAFNLVVFVKDGVTVNNETISLQMFDLTTMFGSGNEPTSTDDPRIAWIEQYVASHPEYNAGELVSADVESVVEQGKNLFNIHGGLISSSGRFTINGETIIIDNFPTNDYFPFAGWISVKPNTQYKISLDSKSIRAMYIYKNSLFGELIGMTDGNKKFVFNSGDNTRVLVGFYSIAQYRVGNEETVSNIQIELGSTATAYSPYHEPNTYHIPASVRNLPGYGWSAGDVYNSIERTETGWKYVQRVGSVNLGTLSFVYSSDNYFYYTSVNGRKPGATKLICSKFETEVGGWTAQATKDIIWGNPTNNSIYIRTTTTYDNVSAFQTAMSGVMLYYELANPIITDITDLMDGVLDAITVEAGGTLTFENAAKLDVPNTIEYAVKLSEVGA